MTKKYEPDIPIDALIGFTLAIVIVALLGNRLADAGIFEYWFGFFILCNIGYIIYGMKKGFVKGDPANGLVIASGPIAFYGWTIISAWRKYGRKTDGHKQKT